MVNEAWKLNDKEWVKERRARWKRVQGQLKQLASFSRVRKDDIRYHKAYLLKGECLQYDEKWRAGRSWIDKRLIGQPYELNAMYRIWYHPVVDETYFKEICEAATINEKLAVFNLVECNYRVDPDYEFFEDRSYFIDRYLVPETCQGVVDLHPKSNRSPRKILYRLLISISICLSATRTAHAKGIYLLAFASELLVDALNKVDLNERYNEHFPPFSELLYKKMKECLYSEPEDDLYIEHGLPIKLREVLRELFDAGVNETVDELWAKAKASKPA